MKRRKPSIFPHASTERGVALIMVLGIVAIIAAWASTAAYEDMIAIQRAANIQDETRATMASESALSLVRLYLKEDLKLTGDIDSLEEDWAVGLPPFPIDDGVIEVTLEDNNRYYNLNDLVDDNGVLIQNHADQLRAIFLTLDLNTDLINPLIDWMDKDDRPSGATGAEDASYYDKDYKVKNNRLDNMQELRLIQGFDKKIIQKLKAAVTVRPSTNNGKTKINLNTCSIEVLMSLFPRLTTVENAQAFLELAPFEDMTILNQQSWKTDGDVQRLSVASDAFTLRTHATFGHAHVREEFLLLRTSQNVQLLWRERLGWQL